MLKVSFTETDTEERWILEGRLTPPGLRELREAWKKSHRNKAGRSCIVDLNGVTFIDKGGERLLHLLAKEGARFIAAGIYTKHVIEHLNAKRKHRSLGVFFLGFFAVQLAVLGITPSVNAQKTHDAGDVSGRPTMGIVIELTLRVPINTTHVTCVADAGSLHRLLGRASGLVTVGRFNILIN